MTICKMQDSPFDVLIKNRIASITSVDWATQLVDECEFKRRKRRPMTDQKSHQQKEGCDPKKQFNETFILTDTIYFGIFKHLTSFVL